MKLIDKDALVAEIERRVNAYQKNFDKSDNKIARLSIDGRIAGLKALLSFISTLEVKEVDLEKSLTGFMGRYAYENGGEYPSAIDIAKHFFELGLKAQKGE